MTDNRKCMVPPHVKCNYCMLNEHSDLWDAADVQEMGLAEGEDDNDDY